MSVAPVAIRVPDPVDSTIFIVGGDSGVGLLIAHHFVRAGAQRIGLVGSDAELGDAAAKSIFGLASGVWALSATGDVRDPAESARILTELSGSLGDADILVNCLPGLPTCRSFPGASADNRSALLRHRTLGPINMSHAVLQGMRAQNSGTIVNVIEEASGSQLPGERLAGFLADSISESEREGVRINSIIHVPTEGPDKGADQVSGMRASQVADLVMYLCSSEAGHINAQCVVSHRGMDVP
ncbi:SDR family oxidoreductase [Rhodococcus erythropolis]|uniref:3-oxoacyl-[acyl-carrier-protein] reductase MabA n=1 Tax=Rhodococcus erythropolis TaxID=1833 RepID=A0AAX3ZXD2_RHOER|nr:SDR family oxidoreductase [Rhodococcus erythropolis]WMN01732.1 SDR family oxidoreductase [Rhodococcus erythropolis]